MDDSARLWTGTLPTLDPDAVEVFLAVDLLSADPAERLAGALLARGHEGEEGVFHLLPDDLTARYLRTGDRLSVTLVSHRAVVAACAADRDDVPDPAALAADPLDPDRVVLLRRETVTGFVPAVRDGEHQPVLLVEHAGGTLAPADLPGLFERGEAGVFVVPAAG
ncbi:hypothetical protein [Streptomyces termitum]|uniref:hypothetical protein n=1 Tax=Streptomyces termitum TaxID=67368 RepID=UPI0033A47484